MKQLKLLLIITFLFAFKNIWAEETESNNTKAQASIMHLNGADTGTFNNANDVDWWLLTTNDDGDLLIDFGLASCSDVDHICDGFSYTIFDEDGTTVEVAATPTHLSSVIKGLIAGKYYIQVRNIHSNEINSKYILYSTLTAPTNDAEPNNDFTQAIVLPLNGGKEGTVGYGNKLKRDSSDWYKITINADGLLRFTYTASKTSINLTLYDNNGTKQIAQSLNSTNGTFNNDGLAAGTYYVRVKCYNVSVYSPYTINNTLIKPAEQNDSEPNNQQSQAINLPQNATKTGHVGYYYNLKRDSADWYKIITNADGLLRFTFTAPITSINLTLYDKNGTKQIAQSLNSTNGTFNNDGLAAGTYFVKVQCYNNAVFTPYTITDSLIKPVYDNDQEPNDSKSQAINLPLNKTKEGHVGYYYNLKRDSSDWYKLTTTADGYLKFKFISVNTSINITLFNKDGITQIAKSLNSTNGTLNYDGLSAGNYFVKVQCYNNAVFTPYTLTDSLITYDFASDEEPNAKPYQAKTILANGVTTGHAGFYNDNNTKDSVDWHKINYTGSGALGFTINQEPYKSNGSRTTMHFYVYKDTAASAVYSGSSAAATFTANLTGLTQGYYWIKINSYDYTDHISYSFTNSFTQVTKAKANILGYDTAATCSNTNYIKVKPGNGNGPFSVMLYRFGISYGNYKTVKKGSQIKFDNLPTGSYYAIAYADGATGDAFGKSATVMMEPTPAGTATQNIKANKATFTWTLEDCAAYYVVKYRKQGTATWTNKETKGNINSFQANNLKPNTMYEWIVATADSANNIVAKSGFTESVSFTTTGSSLIAENEMSEDDATATNILQKSTVIVAPNPATSFFIIYYKNEVKEKVVANLYDMNGKLIWNSGLINGDAINGKKVMINQFGNGIYYLKIINDKGVLVDVAKLMINK